MEAKVFFDHPHDLAKLFTAPVHHDPEKDGKYLEGGLKPIEAFENDIIQNLEQWTTDGAAIFYKTQSYFYLFQKERVSEDTEVIAMSRFSNSSWERMDTWMNLHSNCVGREWLEKPEQTEKRVPFAAGTERIAKANIKFTEDM